MSLLEEEEDTSCQTLIVKSREVLAASNERKKLWNERRKFDSAYLLTPLTAFVPRVEFGIIPEEV